MATSLGPKSRAASIASRRGTDQLKYRSCQARRVDRERESKREIAIVWAMHKPLIQLWPPRDCGRQSVRGRHLARHGSGQVEKKEEAAEEEAEEAARKETSHKPETIILLRLLWSKTADSDEKIRIRIARYPRYLGAKCGSSCCCCCCCCACCCCFVYLADTLSLFAAA